MPTVVCLPSGYGSDKELADSFADFFRTKVDDIVSQFEPLKTPPTNNMQTATGISSFDEFSKLSTQDVCKLRHFKTSHLDHLPTKQFSMFWSSLLPQKMSQKTQ